MKALITGGCSGLGLSFTEYLISKGYTVYATYNKSVDKALELESMYEDKIKCIKCNLKNEEDINNLLFNLNNIDLLINNAAISLDNEIIKKTKKEFMNVLEVNVVGTFLITRGIVSKLNKNGVIINISSNNALNNYNPISIDYDVSKSGINMLTKDFSLYLEELNNNYKIFAICPGWINTDSIKEMNQDYLKEEMKKSNQEKIIDPDCLVKYIIDNLDNYHNGDIVEIKEV